MFYNLAALLLICFHNQIEETLVARNLSWRNISYIVGL